MKSKTVQRIFIGIFFLAAGWAAGTGLLLYKLPNLIMHKLSRLQIERAGALDRWVHKRSTVDHTFRDVVRPNVDTVYSSVFADLSEGPYVLESPPADKYWSFGFYADNTTNFHIISIRTHGTKKPVRVVLVPKGYSGDTPGMARVEAPSDLVWIIARLRIEGKEDEPRIHAIQDQMRFVPLDRYRAG